MDLTKKALEELAQNAEKLKPEARKIFKKLKKKPPKELDFTVQSFHEETFTKINCLACANCCKTLGPRITDHDINRLGKYLKVRPGQLIEKYLRVDEDGDYVFKKMPCPFLMPDNYCMVYEARPKACREYPHTDRKRFYQALDITLKNMDICPAVYEISRKLVVRYK